MSLAWPGTLPRPRIEGDTAVYESVLPDVDLRMRALTDDFSWVLVVKSATAAMNPALETCGSASTPRVCPSGSAPTAASRSSTARAARCSPPATR